MKKKRVILIPILLICSLFTAYAGGSKDDVENVYKYRVGVDLQFKLFKGMKLDVGPELRYYEGYDMFMLNGGLTYKTFGCIYWGASYRLAVDRLESTTTTYSYSGFGSNYDSETYHRYAFDVTYKDDFKRFTPSFRLRYSNYTDDDVFDGEFLRYRAKLEYNIRKCKFTPFISAEGFQELNEMMLYKMRYSTGVDYKFSKNSSLGVDYKLDYFSLKYKNAHIFSIGYKYKF
ncbi:MAG: DUF2490 domain-containing protein [Rikenellaceae bacterium]